MKITKETLKQLIKEELESVLVENAQQKKFLEGEAQTYISKGWKRGNAFPRTLGLKVGSKLKGVYTAYHIKFDDYPIALIMTQGIRGRDPFDGWVVEEKEFKQLIGTDPGIGGKVYAVLYKE